MKTRKINPASILAIGAAALSGFAPGTAPVAGQSAPTVRTSPWDAPIYNQRKARRDARRTNRKVTR